MSDPGKAVFLSYDSPACAKAVAQEPAEPVQRRAILDEAERLFASLTDGVKDTTSGRRSAKRLAAARAEP